MEKDKTLEKAVTERLEDLITDLVGENRPYELRLDGEAGLLMPNPTKVVNIRDGFPEGGIYIGRAGKGYDGYFGNPFKLADYGGDRVGVMVEYETWARTRIEHDDEFAERVRKLYGETLVCFCAPKLCHGEVLADLAEELVMDFMNGYQ